MSIVSNCFKPEMLAGLVLAFSATVVQATPVSNFAGSFAPGQWTLQPDQGQVYFANGNTELDIVGPTGNFFPSYDAVSVVGPSSGAPGAQWQLNFHWVFNGGDSQGTTASIYWAGIPGGNPIVFASGGPGTVSSGDYSFILDQGETAQILLDSDVTGSGKQASSFVISTFSYSVPDATPWIEASLFLPLLVRRFWPVIRRQS